MKFILNIRNNFQFQNHFSATKSNYAHLMTEYVTAQQIGEGKIGPGECFPYFSKCPKSIFKSGRKANKYR